jgi:multimeric flavodoxin WrbA
MNLHPRRTSQDHKISKKEFLSRFHRQFCDPHFTPFRNTLEEMGEVAWENYIEGRKAPDTHPAGKDYHDPHYELSEDWISVKKAVTEATTFHTDLNEKTRILLILASDRNEGTCPGEYSKTARLAAIAEKTLKDDSLEVEILDLSLMTAEYGKTIYPCKGCVSSAMPLCHWPCSCYPNHSLGQTHDWMNDIYPMWVRAHGIMIITPVYWHQAPSCLKLMMDRLVCADGGNEDPTTTQGKEVKLAKEIEMKGWHYPRHLKDRIFSLIVHGDTAGAEGLKSALTSWLSDMQLIPAGSIAQIARYIGYYRPYATSHFELDEDKDIQTEVHNAAQTLAMATKAFRNGELKSLSPDLCDPRPK